MKQKISSKAGIADQYHEKTDTDLSTCSTTECTGLIPSGITDEEMIQNYSELYPYLPIARD